MLVAIRNLRVEYVHCTVKQAYESFWRILLRLNLVAIPLWRILAFVMVRKLVELMDGCTVIAGTTVFCCCP